MVNSIENNDAETGSPVTGRQLGGAILEGKELKKILAGVALAGLVVGATPALAGNTGSSG